MDFEIVQGTIEEALEVLKNLPEFDELSPFSYYEEKLRDNDSLILVAKVNGTPVACKLGYDRFRDGSFYSWLGGVMPQCRKHGIAKALADQQEQWAKATGYDRIRFKTLNRHKTMLVFSLTNGFEIFNVKPKDELENYRIELVKYLE